MKYNIHNLVKIKSNIDIGLPYIFQVKRCLTPDLIVHIGNFTDIGEEEEGDVCYYEHKLGPLKSKFLLSHLNGKIKLFYKSPRYRIQPGIRQSIISMILAIIDWKLLQKNCALIFGACLEKEGEGILIIAPSRGGKTLTSISLVKDYGFNYLSDDKTIVSKDGIAYSYPTKMKINPSHIGTHKINLKLKARIEMSISSIFRMLSSLSFSREFAIDIYKILQNVNIKRKAHIEKIFLLEGGKERIQEVDSEAVLKKIYNIIFLVPHLLTGYDRVLRFLHLFRLGEVIAMRDKVIRSVINGSQCFVVGGRCENYGKIIAGTI